MQLLPAKSDQSGFTLVEVLVAFVVSALMLTMIFSAVQIAGERRTRVTMQAHAVAIARTRMELFLVRRFEQKADRGQDNGLVWHEEEDAAMSDPRGMIVLARLRLSVTDSSNRQVLSVERRQIKSAIDQ